MKWLKSYFKPGKRRSFLADGPPSWPLSKSATSRTTKAACSMAPIEHWDSFTDRESLRRVGGLQDTHWRTLQGVRHALVRGRCHPCAGLSLLALWKSI